MAENINDILDALIKLKSLTEKPIPEKSNSRHDPIENKEEAATLELIIREQKRDYDFLVHIYDRMRATEGLLLTAAFGILGYLYHPLAAGTKMTLMQRISFPSDDSERVIYVIAGAFFLYGVIKLTLNVFGKNPWMTAYESSKTSYEYNKLKTLRYIKHQYEECHSFNQKAYFKRKDELSFLFFCILISAIILIVIKTLK
ncbi:MAG TPA: hypothetical protein VG604_04050 [Candidatus Saccharimonadales bacterium]|nr:hypothetical protein [Candidatus Saccharimonadales bacterium]